METPFDFSFPSRQVVIDSDFDLAQSQAKLRAIVKPDPVWFFAKAGLVGSVERGWVVVRFTYVGSRGSPELVGQLRAAGNKAQFRGMLTLSSSTKMYCSFVYLFFMIGIIMSIFVDGLQPVGVLVCMGGLVAANLSVRYGFWWNRSDAQFIEREVRKALTRDPNTAPTADGS